MALAGVQSGTLETTILYNSTIHRENSALHLGRLYEHALREIINS